MALAETYKAKVVELASQGSKGRVIKVTGKDLGFNRDAIMDDDSTQNDFSVVGIYESMQQWRFENVRYAGQQSSQTWQTDGYLRPGVKEIASSFSVSISRSRLWQDTNQRSAK